MTESTLTSFGGYKVKLEDVESEFRNIWNNVNDKPGEPAIVKASSMNLVMTFKNEADLKKTLDQVLYITAHHPGRIIMVYINEHSDLDSFNCQISAFCQPPRDDGKQICCELLLLETGKKSEKHIAGTILPLLLQDLPVYMWSPNNLALKNPNITLLQKNIDRIILNSPAFYTSKSDIIWLADFIINTETAFYVSDMGWARLTNWRESIAQFFDGKDGLELLSNINSISFYYSGQDYCYNAYLLTAWMAAITDWRYIKGNDMYTELHYKKNNGSSLFVTINSVSKENKTNELQRIEITTSAREKVTLLLETKENETISTKTIVQDKVIPGQTISNTIPDDYRLLCHELDFLKKDNLFIDTMRQIEKIFSRGHDERIY